MTNIEVVKRDKHEARQAVDRLVDAYNRKDRDSLATLYAEGISLWTTLGEPTSGRDRVLAHIDELFARLPDEHMDLDVVATDGETVVIEVTSTGTDGRGRRYEIEFTEVLEMADGQFTQIRTYIDPDVVEAISA